MKTLMPKQVINQERKWYLIDATGQTLGRLSTQIATLLRGKNKVAFAPHVDNGDYVVVINSEKIEVTGNKLQDKIYYQHSGYMGGLKETSLERLLDKKPTEVLQKAVLGMLPKNKLRKEMILRLKLVVGSQHNFKAQKPETITL